MKRTIVTLIGSTRFRKEFEEAMRTLTLQGKIVLTVGMFGFEEGLQDGSERKTMLDALHIDKIDMSSEVFVVNGRTTICEKCVKPAQMFKGINWTLNPTSDCCRAPMLYRPYIGASTRRELAHAVDTGKKIEWLNPHLGTVGIS